MCVVSQMIDRTKDRWIPQISPDQAKWPVPSATKQDIEDLRKEFKKDIEELKELIKAAKIIDEEEGNADCGSQDKIDALEAIAKALGVEIEIKLDVV